MSKTPGVMDPLAPRVVERFAGAVVPFRPKPGVPTEAIGGRHYNLSTDGGPLGDMEEPGSGWLGGESESGEGARVIHVNPIENKWRFLWAYDTDRKYVAMWRVTDGNEKEAGSDTHYGMKIVRLEKKGQINRVSHAEFETIEREMRRREDEQLQALRESIEQSKTDFEKKLDEVVRDYFEKFMVAKIERAVEGVKNGAIPIGFEPHGPAVHDERVRLRQAVAYTIGMVLRRDLTEEKLEAYAKHRGLDMSENTDSQSLYWAIGDLQEAAYDRFLPPR